MFPEKQKMPRKSEWMSEKQKEWAMWIRNYNKRTTCTIRNIPILYDGSNSMGLLLQRFHLSKNSVFYFLLSLLFVSSVRAYTPCPCCLVKRYLLILFILYTFFCPSLLLTLSLFVFFISSIKHKILVRALCTLEPMWWCCAFFKSIIMRRFRKIYEIPLNICLRKKTKILKYEHWVYEGKK